MPPTPEATEAAFGATPACEPSLFNLASSKLAVWCVDWIRLSGVSKTIPVELRELRRALSALPPSEERDDYESCPNPNSTRELKDLGVP